VSCDGILRVFSSPHAEAATIIHRAAVIGPVLACKLWQQRQCIVTLEETPQMSSKRSTSDVAARLIRIYSWPSGDVTELALESLTPLLASPSSSSKSSSHFAPSLMSLCPYTGVLALAHDCDVRLYDLNTISAIATKSQHMPAMVARRDDDEQVEGEPEPGGMDAGADADSDDADASNSLLPRSSSSSSIPPSLPPLPTQQLIRIHALTPLLTLRAAEPVRHLEYVQSNLCYASHSECMWMQLDLALATAESKAAALREKQAEQEEEERRRKAERQHAQFQREQQGLAHMQHQTPASSPHSCSTHSRSTSSSSSSSSHLSAMSATSLSHAPKLPPTVPGSASARSSMRSLPATPASSKHGHGHSSHHPHRRQASGVTSTPATSDIQPCELLYSHNADDAARSTNIRSCVRVHDDVRLLAVSVWLRRRLNPSDQIHTIKLVPTNFVPPSSSSPSASAVAAHAVTAPQSATLTTGTRSRASSNAALSSSSFSSVPASVTPRRLSSRPSVKQSLYALLGRGMPTQPFAVPIESSASATTVPGQLSRSAAFVGSAPTSTSTTTCTSTSSFATHSGVVVELLDEEDEEETNNLGQTMTEQEELLAALERMEEMNENAARMEERDLNSIESGSFDPEPSSPTALFPSLRIQAPLLLPTRLLLSSSEGECALYAAPVSTSIVSSAASSSSCCSRIATHVFDSDLVSLTVRGGWILALTTTGFEVHGLWTPSAFRPVLTLPLALRADELATYCDDDVLAESATTLPAGEHRMTDMVVLDDCVLLRPSQAALIQTSMGGVASHRTARSMSAALLLPVFSTYNLQQANIATSSMEDDPCETWPAPPMLPIPSVQSAVESRLVAPALRGLDRGREAGPSTLRLLAEAWMLLAQRRAQLTPPNHGPDQTVSDEYYSLVLALVRINRLLYRVFLQSHSIPLAAHFGVYASGVSCELDGHGHGSGGRARKMSMGDAVVDVRSIWDSLHHAPESNSSVANIRSLCKYAILVLLRPTSAEWHLLQHDPSFLVSLVSYLCTHASHLIGALLLRTCLLYCAYDTRQLLHALDRSANRGEYQLHDASMPLAHDSSSQALSGRHSRGGSTGSTPMQHGSMPPTPTSATAKAYAAHTQRQPPLQVRPVVFHTFVQALMHLESANTAGAEGNAGEPDTKSFTATISPSSASSPMSASTSHDSGAASSTDKASILLHSFSTHSLQLLLLAHPHLLIRWKGRDALLYFLRRSVPAILMDVVVALTQRGQIDAAVGIQLLTGSIELSPAILSASSLSPSSHDTLPLLVSYLERSLAPFMLTSAFGNILERDHAFIILPWDSEADRANYIQQALNGTKASVESPDGNIHAESNTRQAAITPDGNDRFIPIQVRALNIIRPHQHIVPTPSGPAITRHQIASLAHHLACVYIHRESSGATGAGVVSTSPSSSSSPTSSGALDVLSPSMRQMNVNSSSSPLQVAQLDASSPHNHANSPSAAAASHAAMMDWWRAGWLDEWMDSSNSHVNQAANQALSLRSPSSSTTQDHALNPRLRRLQAILCAALPLSSSHFQSIYALLLQLRPTLDDRQRHRVWMSLMLLVLPRVGRLAAAVRLVLSHGPSVIWKYAQVYCFCGADVTGSGIRSLLAPSFSCPASSPVDQHCAPDPARYRYTAAWLRDECASLWKLLHAALLLHIYHSTHSHSVILQQYADALQSNLKPTERSIAGLNAAVRSSLLLPDATQARDLLSTLLPGDVLDQMFEPLPCCHCDQDGEADASPSFFPCRCSSQSHSLSLSFASFVHSLYQQLLDWSVVYHPPRLFLSFIPAAGSARYYMPLVRRNFIQHRAAEWRSKLVDELRDEDDDEKDDDDADEGKNVGGNAVEADQAHRNTAPFRALHAPA